MTNKPINRQQWIFDLLQVENSTFGEMFGKYVEMFGSISEVTFTKDWKKSNQKYKDYQLKLNNAKDKVIIANEISTLKNGLKSKTERLLTLQNRLNKLEQILDDGMTQQLLVIKELPYEQDRKLTVTEIVNLSKAVKELQSEISKIEGDYILEVKTNVLEIKPIEFKIIN